MGGCWGCGFCGGGGGLVLLRGGGVESEVRTESVV